MFYFIHPTDENFPALWYQQYLGLSEQHRLNILLKGSHITTCTETSNPLAISSERQLRSTLAVQACVWPMHVNVESLLLGGGGSWIPFSPGTFLLQLQQGRNESCVVHHYGNRYVFGILGLLCSMFSNHMPDWSASKRSPPSFQLFKTLVFFPPFAAPFLLLMSLSLDLSSRVSI